MFIFLYHRVNNVILSRSLGGAEDQNSFVDLENPASSEDESNDTRHDQLLDCIKSFGRQKWYAFSSCYDVDK